MHFLDAWAWDKLKIGIWRTNKAFLFCDSQQTFSPKCLKERSNMCHKRLLGKHARPKQQYSQKQAPLHASALQSVPCSPLSFQGLSPSAHVHFGELELCSGVVLGSGEIHQHAACGLALLALSRTSPFCTKTSAGQELTSCRKTAVVWSL